MYRYFVVIAQVEAKDSWQQDFMQEISVTITVSGEFHDRGTVEGEADVGDAMEYTVRVANPGSVTLTDVGESPSYPASRRGPQPVYFIIAVAGYTIRYYFNGHTIKSPETEKKVTFF